MTLLVALMAIGSVLPTMGVSTPAYAAPPVGTIETLYDGAGSGPRPSSPAVTPDGDIYLQTGAASISRLDPDGTLDVIASGRGCPTDYGDSAGRLCSVVDLAAHPDGNLYAASNEYAFPFGGPPTVYRITPSGQVDRVGGAGSGDPNIGGSFYDSALPTIGGIDIDDDANGFLTGGDRVFRVTNSLIHRIAGTGVSGFSGDGGPALSAMLEHPTAVASGPDGQLYFADLNRIRRIDLAGNITTIAGTGVVGYTGDGGPATAAQIKVDDLVVAPDGRIYLAGGTTGAGAGRVRVIDLDGTIHTAAGTGTLGSSGDGGPATEAEVAPTDLGIDPQGRLLITDSRNRTVRRVSWPSSIEGTLLDNGGQPANGVIVTIMNDWPSWQPVTSTVTDSNGEYRFEGVLHGDYRVRFVDPQGRFQRRWWSEEDDYATASVVELETNEVRILDATMVPVTTGPLRGRVTERRSGAGMPDVSVLVFNGPRFVAGVRTGPTGDYSLTDLPPGDYRLLYAAPDRLTHPLSWYPGVATSAEADEVTLGGAGLDLDVELGLPSAPAAMGITSGALHTCARLDTAEVTCWGRNPFGQLGDGVVGIPLSPVVTDGIAEADQVTAGFVHTCALLTSGGIGCWGDNRNSQIGDPTLTTDVPGLEVALQPRAVDGVTDAVQIAAGSSHTCAVLADTTVRCWGRNWFGSLGNGNGFESDTAVAVVGLSNAVEVAAGHRFTCARLADGTVTCWGTSPLAVPGITDAVDIEAGNNHTCAVRAEGSVVCWGGNSWGQLGDGTTNASTTPVTVAGLSDAARVTGSYSHSCAATSDGRVLCWGDSDNLGLLGRGSLVGSLTALEVPGIG